MVPVGLLQTSLDCHASVGTRTLTTAIISDFVSLLLQAVGGAMVSLADDYDFEQEGLHVMQSGLIFQVASLLVFVALCALFAWTCRQKSTVLDQRFAELRSLPRFHFFLWCMLIQFSLPLPDDFSQ